MSTRRNLAILLWLGFARLSHQICTDIVEQGPGTYYYYSTNYPQKDNIDLCRKKLVVPQDHQIVAECNIDIDTKDDGTCDMKLLISKDGDLNMNDAYTFCGYGETNLTSNLNSMAFAYESTQGIDGSEGRFLCQLSVIPIEPITCECGWYRSTRIIGGSDAEVGEFPSMAGVVKLADRDIYCGGTIISSRFVVTAKHCVVSETVDTIAIAVGFVNRIGNTGESGKVYSIGNIHMFPNTTDEINDIALLVTTVNMEFSHVVGPACLPFIQQEEHFVYKEVTLAGWGTTEYRGSRSDTLQKINVNVIPNYECKMNYNELEENSFCTYAPEEDACQFDSGGPVYLQKLVQFLVGVISYGNRCGEYEGVNTKITPYLGWIRNIAESTNNEQLCFKEIK